MSAESNTPTVASIAEDLTIAMEVHGEVGYAYNADTDTITIETYTDDGEIDRTFNATITIKENN